MLRSCNKASRAAGRPGWPGPGQAPDPGRDERQHLHYFEPGDVRHRVLYGDHQSPPEIAILTVGKIEDTPVGVDGKIKLRPMMNITLSADHWVVDGAAAAQFLAELNATLENPYLLV